MNFPFKRSRAGRSGYIRGMEALLHRFPMTTAGDGAATEILRRSWRFIVLAAVMLCVSVLAAVMLCVSVPAAVAQGSSAASSQMSNTAATDEPKYTFAGTVINSLTGEPIIRALVQIMGQNSPRATFTDREGRFQFANMKAMTGQVTAIKPGFYATDAAVARQVQANLRVTIGPEMSPVTLRLVPESGISGQVMDENGEPLEGVRVTAMTNVIQQGLKRRQNMQSIQTNEQGEFHLSNLPPGSYMLSAGPVWNRQTGDSAGGYAQQFYPGVMEPAQAGQIQLSPGQNVRADLTLPSAKTFHITGLVSGTNPGYPQIINDGGDPAGTVEQFDPNTGTFEARVTCNLCIIKSRSGNPRTEQQYGEITLNMNGDRDNVHVAMSPISVPVQVEYQSSKLDTQSVAVDMNGTAIPQRGQRGRGLRNVPMSVRLVPVSRTHPDAFSAPSGGGPDGPTGFAIVNVEFARYTAQVGQVGGGWYVASARYGGTNIDEEPMDVQPGPPQPIEIVLRDDGATLSGTVTGATDVNQQVSVVLIPTFAPNRVRLVPTSPAGGFQLSNLAPGLYKLYAFDTVKDLEYANAEAMQIYSGSATETTLQASGTTTVTLNLIKRAQ